MFVLAVEVLGGPGPSVSLTRGIVGVVPAASPGVTAVVLGIGDGLVFKSAPFVLGGFGFSVAITFPSSSGFPTGDTIASGALPSMVAPTACLI